MSATNGSGWVGPIMAILAGGLVAYGVTQNPGSCPLNPYDSPGNNPSVDVASAPVEAASKSAADDEGPLVHAGEASFDKLVLQAEGPVLVDFYADWCGPCQRLAPILDRVAKDLTDGRIVKVDVDDNPRLASQYDVRSIPTLLVFVDGEIVERKMGLLSEEEVRKLLEQ